MRKCLIQHTPKVTEDLFVEMIPELIHIFTLYGKDMALGTYESPLENNAVILPLLDPK